MSREGERLLLAARRPLWVPDSAAPNCEACGRRFGATLRRHHCRICGCVFCSRCCCDKVYIPSLGYADPQLACAECLRGAPCVVGMTVQVNQDVLTVRRLCHEQTHLPEWDPRKAAFCGAVGKIDSQDPRDGSVRVLFANKSFSWYPPSCLALYAGPEPQSHESVLRVAVQCPSRPYLEGAYSRLEEKFNKTGVYALSTCRLYSNTRGHWVLTVTAEGMHSGQGAIRSAVPHNGKLHPWVIPKWESFSNGKWVPFPDFRVLKATAPVGSAPCMNSGLKYVQPLRQAGNPSPAPSPPAGSAANTPDAAEPAERVPVGTPRQPTSAAGSQAGSGHQAPAAPFPEGAGCSGTTPRPPSSTHSTQTQPTSAEGGCGPSVGSSLQAAAAPPVFHGEAAVGSAGAGGSVEATPQPPHPSVGPSGGAEPAGAEAAFVAEAEAGGEGAQPAAACLSLPPGIELAE